MASTFEYEADVPYLHIFPRALGKQCPNISPFAVKVETWLRLNGIKYKVREVTSLADSPTGQIPYLYYNGTTLADSRLIIQYLQDKYSLDPTEGLTPEQQAVYRAMCQMLEEATSFTVFHFRYVERADLYRKIWRIHDDPETNNRLIQELSHRVSERMKAQGIGRKTPEEIAALGKADVKALSQYLGVKPFFFGEKATLLDCCVFGLLSQLVGVDCPFPHQEFINSKQGENLVAFMTRMKNQVWPDWDEIVDMSTFE